MKIKLLFLAIVMAIFGLGVAVPTTTYALIKDDPLCKDIKEDDLKAAAGCGEKEQATSRASDIISAVIGIVGFLAVTAMIYGGIQYTLSQGDGQKVKKARDVILYGLVGLIVALIAFAIVSFVSSGVA